MVKQSAAVAVANLVDRIERAPDQFIFAVFSGVRGKNQEIQRIRLRPVLLKDGLRYQVSSFTKTQCFTVNVKQEELRKLFLASWDEYQQLVLRFIADEVHCHFQGDLVSLKEKPLKNVSLPQLAHNKAKERILQDGERSLVMQEIGIMNKEGRVFREKYDKFKQVNRFLEIVLDVLPENKEGLKIVDFGCGRAYLTFALAEILEGAQFIGVDAREDVIATCQALSQRLEFSNMQFVKASISDYEAKDVDLVLALHACDTATDDALCSAISANARMILVAPCCQHEVATQLNSNGLPLVCKHNLLRERFSALLTDAIRAEVLEQFGYSVDLVEFVDPEHTPKNLLIRAVKRRKEKQPDFSGLNALLSQFNVCPKLVRDVKSMRE